MYRLIVIAIGAVCALLGVLNMDKNERKSIRYGSVPNICNVLYWILYFTSH